MICGTLWEHDSGDIAGARLEGHAGICFEGHIAFIFLFEMRRSPTRTLCQLRLDRIPVVCLEIEKNASSQD